MDLETFASPNPLVKKNQLSNNNEIPACAGMTASKKSSVKKEKIIKSKKSTSLIVKTNHESNIYRI